MSLILAIEPLSAAALVASITVLVLAIFLGFELISKVPPTLHTPLMSGANAISGICLLYTSPSPRDKRQSRMPSSA